MKRRGAGDDGPPAELLAYRAEDWAEPGELDKPAPAWWDRAYAYGEHEAVARWCAARRAWLRRHARTTADVNLLYGPDVRFPPDTDPRSERTLALAFHPTLREQGR